MIQVKYVNSINQSISFFSESMKVSQGNVHQRKWTISEDDITKDAITYNLTLTLRGKIDERKQMLNNLYDIFEIDLINKIPGKLYFGDYYIRCYMQSASTEPNSILNCRTDNVLEVYCPRQEWIKETVYSLNSQSQDTLNEEIGMKKYTYSYPFVYNSQKDLINILNDGIDNADVIIRMFGPALNPFVKIGDTVYQILSEIDSNEYFEINTIDRTIYKVSSYGQKTNAFMYRSKDRSEFFVKISPGTLQASWGSNYDAEVVVVAKRTEPRWA